MKHFVFLLFLLFSVALFCQANFSVSGFVSDSDNNPIEIADVMLLSKENNIILKYTFIENGIFYLSNIKKGTYLLKINSLSHTEFSQEIIVHKNLEVQFSLINKNEVLKEVTITAHKNLIENKKGNINVTIENSILAQEPTTLGLLSKLPKLQLNETQETIEVLGKGTPLLYVNNQQVSFQMLSTLQVDEIKNIEIINNPSSKYEANATSVLFITLKKNETDGLKLLLKETASCKTYFNNYLSSYFTLKKGAIEGKLSLSYNHINVWESNGATYEIPHKNIYSDYSVEAVTNRRQVILNGGFYYQINENDYFSINSNTQIQEEPFSINTTTNYTENNSSDFIDTRSTNLGERTFTTSVLNYQKHFKNSHELFLVAQHSYYQKKITNTIRNTFTNMNSTINRTQVFSIRSYNFKINYEKKFAENQLLEIGMNFSETNTLTDNDIGIYKFTEKNKAIYSQFSNELSNKLSYSLGLRLEENATIGSFTTSKSNEYQKKSTQLFPTINIYYPFKKEQSLTFNYSKRINRPSFSSLSNTTAYINPYLEFTGNLKLENAIIDEVSLSYQLNKKAITLQYNYTNKPIKAYTFNYDTTNESTIVLPLNLLHKTNISLEASFPISYKFWSSNNMVSLIYSNVKDSRATETYLKPYVYYYSNQKISLNSSTSINLNVWGTTLKGEGSLSTKPVATLNTSIQKKINNINITLSYNDIFKSLKFGETYSLKNINVDNLFLIDANEVSISLKYNFGTIKKSNYQNNSINNTNRIR